jgi:N-formylglutamate amidohydrolase
MGDHQIIIGTRHAATCARELVAVTSAVFTRHGFVVHENVAGYTGGNIVATYGQPEALRTHAMQIEVNAGLLVTCAGDEVVTRITRGEIPDKAEATIERLRACLRELVASLPAVLASLHEPSR